MNKSYLTGIQEVNRSQRPDRLHEKIDLAPALGEEPFAHHLEFKFGAEMAEVGDEHLRELSAFVPPFRFNTDPKGENTFKDFCVLTSVAKPPFFG